MPEPAERRRVLHVVATGQRRGAEVFAADLCDALRDRGFDQRFAVVRAGADDATALFEDAWVDLRGSGHLGSLRAVTRLRVVVRQWRPNVLLAHGGEALRACVLAATGRPIVYRRIGAAPATMSSAWRLRWHQRLMSRASLIVAVAEVLRAELIEVFGVPAEKVITIPNAVAQRRVEPGPRDASRASLGIPPDASVVASIGALSWEKEPLRALSATQPLRSSSNVTHVFAGDGPLRTALEEAVTAEPPGLGDVRILGSTPAIGRVLGAADVVLLASSANGMEGMPAVVIEAGLAGLPVVSTDVAGVREVIVDGVSGMLVPPGDSPALTEALASILADQSRSQKLGAAARDRCRAEFTIDAVRSAWVAAIDRVAPW